jgi:hypothetical protein
MASSHGLDRVTSREYKLILDHRLFSDSKKGAARFIKEVRRCSRGIASVKVQREFDEVKEREIVFLDTPDATVRQNGWVFRRRRDLQKCVTEYTLKCRSPDFYLASEADVVAEAEFDGCIKLEEDIGAPFTPRYSRSCTVKGPRKSPNNLKQAAAIFPALGQLARDGVRCKGTVKLGPTSSVTIFERVFAGLRLKLAEVKSEAAIILWSDGPSGRPLTAEFSFRYSVDKTASLLDVAKIAMEFFEALQRLDWCLPGARSKTQYIYQDTGF